MAQIAYVVWTFPVLSQTFVIEELLAVEELGWRPTVVARSRPDEEAPENPRAAGLLGRTTWLDGGTRRSQAATVLRVTARHPWRAARCAAVAVRSASRWSVRNLWWGALLGALAERQHWSLLHVHFADDAGDIAFFASTLVGVPYVLTVHAVDIYVGRFLCRKLRSAESIVTVCRYNVEQIGLRCPGTSLDSTLIKYAGVDIERFRRSRAHPAGPGREILAVGRLVEKKGFGVLIEAVAELVAAGRDVHCLIVGGGPLRSDLVERVARHGLAGVVEIRGPASPDDLLALYEEADLLAAPCTVASWSDRDSMPVVIKEAMAMELPVVASNDFGIPELVEPGTGVLVERDDASALAEGLAQVLDAPPEVRAAMGRAGRRVVEERFQERDGAKLLTAHWERLLTGR